MRVLHLLDEPAAQAVPAELDEVQGGTIRFHLNENRFRQVAGLVRHVEIPEAGSDAWKGRPELLEHSLESRPEHGRKERKSAG
jgi:hypothetical protein